MVHPGVIVGGVRVRKWQCMVCGYVYDEAVGIPEDGIPPGTAWEQIPDDWVCPDCGVAKDSFELIAVDD